MQKEELLHLHMLLVHLKKYEEGVAQEEIPTIAYNSLKISPVHIHKNKICHKNAILSLSNELVDYFRIKSPFNNYPNEIKSKEMSAEHIPTHG